MSSDPCIYQPREFALPSHARLVEIVRDELNTLAVLINAGCLRPILPEQLPPPLPEIIENPENIEHLARLDCCGLIVRDCTFGGFDDTEPGFDPTFEPEQILAFPTWTGPTGGNQAWPAVPLPDGGYYRFRVNESSGNIHNVGGFYTVWTQTVDADGNQISNVSASAPAAQSGNATYRYALNSKIYVVYANTTTPARAWWYVDGTKGDFVNSAVETTANQSFHAVEWPYYVPGLGVYGFGRSNSPAEGSQKIIHFWPCPDPSTTPAATPTNHIVRTNGITPSLRFFGHDSQYLYAQSGGNVYRIPLDLSSQEQLLFNVGTFPSLPGNQLNNVINTLVVTCEGTIIAFSFRTVVNTTTNNVGFYDITDINNPVHLATIDIGYSAASANNIGRSEIHWVNAGRIMQVCPGEIPIEIGEPGTVGWRCYELLTVDGDRTDHDFGVSDHSNGRISIFNIAAQNGGNPEFDLALVEQAEGGAAQAFTVDDWGRVVETRPLEAADIPDLSDLYVPQGSGGVLPVVTGEVPPVLVYLDDGSLVYSGVA